MNGRTTMAMVTVSRYKGTTPSCIALHLHLSFPHRLQLSTSFLRRLDLAFQITATTTIKHKR